MINRYLAAMVLCSFVLIPSIAVCDEGQSEWTGNASLLIGMKKLMDDDWGIFKEYHWPGNVRELHNLIERLLIMSGEQIMVSDIPVEFMLNDETDLQNYRGLPLKEFREIVEKDYIIRILRNSNGNISKASRILKIDRTYLHKKMSQYEISKRDYFSAISG